MDKALIELMLYDLQENNKEIDLFSRNYFFDKQYAKHRSKSVMLGGTLKRRTLLSLLIREGMTAERRKKIFPSDYDLGNMRAVPSALCTYVSLADELYGSGRNGIAGNDAFETIQKSIHRITGRKMQEHFKFNASTTVKVIKTLNVLTRSRQSSLMQLLTPPDPLKKFSMSFRDAYPYEKNQDQAWLIADLKAYLSAELSDKRFEEIGITFSSLNDVMNTILWNVEKILVGAYRSAPVSMIAAYESLTTTIEGFQFQRSRKALPLDEELFIHLHALEFAHFAIGYQQLIGLAAPQCAVIPVYKELRAFANKVFPASMGKMHEYDLLIAIEEVPSFALRWQKEIIDLVEKALGASVTLKMYDKMTTNVQNLLRNFYLFRSGGESAPLEHVVCISPWYVIAAFCCVWYNFKVSPEFEPYWVGQFSQGKSIKPAVTQRLTEDGLTVETVAEEHHHLWINRLEWFADALRGQAELKEARFAFRSALINKFLDICSTNNTDHIAQEVANLADYLRAHSLPHHRAS